MIVVAIIGLVGVIATATIQAIVSSNSAKLSHDIELTRLALESIPQQGEKVQATLGSTFSIPISTPVTNLCSFQSETDWGTIKNIFNAEGKAFVEEDMAVMRQIYAPDANIREAHSAVGGNQVIPQFLSRIHVHFF